MTESLKTLILNQMFLMLPLFLVQMIWLDRPGRHSLLRWWQVGSLGGLACCLCITFPYYLKEGLLIDLRQVGLVACLVYGGWRGGAMAAVTVLLYRSYLGGAGVFTTILTTVFLFVGYLLLKRFLRKDSPSARMAVVVVLSLLGASGVELAFYLHWNDMFHDALVQAYLLEFTLVQAASSWLLAYLVEMMIRNQTLREVLEQSKKMKLVSELAASVSHEVRNPLTVTRGFLQLLRKDGLPEEKRAGFIELALTELDRAESIISDYLSFAKPQAGKADRLMLHQEIRFLADVISPFAAMNRVDIQVNLMGDCAVRGERDRFRQCLMNLAKNAVEAMPDGGSLHISVIGSGRHVDIMLRDTGVGMTKQQIERLGTPYYSTKDKGTGLGTMVVYSIIKAMDGRIKVSSSPGEGTCFVLTLPIEEEAAAV